MKLSCTSASSIGFVLISGCCWLSVFQQNPNQNQNGPCGVSAWFPGSRSPPTPWGPRPWTPWAASLWNQSPSSSSGFRTSTTTSRVSRTVPTAPASPKCLRQVGHKTVAPSRGRKGHVRSLKVTLMEGISRKLKSKIKTGHQATLIRFSFCCLRLAPSFILNIFWAKPQQ